VCSSDLLLKLVSSFAKYSLLTNFSSLIEKESIMPFSSLIEIFLILSLSPEVVIIESKLKKEALNPLSITLLFLKLSSNGDEISILDTLKVFAFK